MASLNFDFLCIYLSLSWELRSNFVYDENGLYDSSLLDFLATVIFFLVYLIITFSLFGLGKPNESFFNVNLCSSLREGVILPKLPVFGLISLSAVSSYHWWLFIESLIPNPAV